MKRWDIFCKIVDNFGDIGVCWRLAKRLRAEHGLLIRLWIDDLEAAQQIIPGLSVAENSQVCDEVTILKWPNSHTEADADFTQAAEVVIEAFACGLPHEYLAAMEKQQSKWVNVEHLSAEPWVEDFHAKPSPQANGLVRYFYFPGFTENTGGLIREAHIESQLQSLDNPRPQAGEGARQRGRGAWQVDLNVAPVSNLSHETTKHLTWPTSDISQVIANPAGGCEALKISLFCYPHAPIHSLLTALQANQHQIIVYIPASSILPTVAAFFGRASLKIGQELSQHNLTVQVLPFLSQADYDTLLSECDLNFVRGEDSWVRAIWAGKPFIWQPYFQDESAHIKKLDAFLDLFYADFEPKKVVCEANSSWVSEQFSTRTWQTYLENIAAINAFTLRLSKKLAHQTDLATKLVIFCNHL
ncbi:MAG: elongation factor P maturation arginine rhamnosyltransferase EarP [Bdellovibrio sp.]|nr:elongation factor P maturation arginine rhamnosyltransferase EarP [Methylotenera sp.]